MCNLFSLFIIFIRLSDLCLSQALLSQTSVEMDPKDKDRQRIFQEKAVEAGVIIVVLSKAFAVSKISQQQVWHSHKYQFIWWHEDIDFDSV